MIENAVPFVVFAVATVLLWGLLYSSQWLSRRVVAIGARKLARKVSAPEKSNEAGAPPWVWFLTVGLLTIGLLIGGGWLFLEIAGDIFMEGSELFRVDEAVHERASELRTEPLHWFFMTMAAVGEKEGLATILAAAVLIAAARREWALSIWALITGAGGGALNRLLKVAFSRERPDLAIAAGEASGFSFPSGHTMGSLIVIGTVVWVAMRLTESRKAASFALASGMMGIAAISASRIYLGVHWMTDIVAGLSAGTVWLVLCLVLYEAGRRLRSIRTATPDAEIEPVPD